MADPGSLISVDLTKVSDRQTRIDIVTQVLIGNLDLNTPSERLAARQVAESLLLEAQLFVNRLRDPAQTGTPQLTLEDSSSNGRGTPTPSS